MRVYQNLYKIIIHTLTVGLIINFPENCQHIHVVV